MSNSFMLITVHITVVSKKGSDILFTFKADYFGRLHLKLQKDLLIKAQSDPRAVKTTNEFLNKTTNVVAHLLVF